MKFFLVFVMTLANSSTPDVIVANTISSRAGCEVAARVTSPQLRSRLVGTRKTDGTEVIGASAICVEGTEADTTATIKARALRERR